MACSSVARATARSSSGEATASTAPAFRALSARCSVAPAIQVAASSTPMMRGRRTVPPQPGRMPSLVSGRPTLAAVLMTRKSQARQISKPPPRAKPLIATQLGKGRSCRRLRLALLAAVKPCISSGPAPKMPVNSVMSAPTMNTGLPLVTSRPRSPLCASSALSASVRLLTVAWSNLLTDSPFRSKCSSAISPSRRVTVSASLW